MQNKKISIIVPLYNAEKYIEQTIEDLIAQTYQNIEIIMINDGSVDKSEDIVRKYAREDDRIKVISIENQGPSKARNVGLNLATGDYIRFVDADDRIPRDSIEQLMQHYLDDSELDLVIGNYRTIPEMGYFTGDKLPTGRVDQTAWVHFFLEHVKTFYFGVPWNKLYRRNIIEEKHIRFREDMNWCEDFLYNIEYFDSVRYAYIHNSESGVYQYKICDTGITLNLKNNMAELERIDRLRYEEAGNFFDRHACLQQFEQQWELAELYKRLLYLTMYHSGTLSERYDKFKKYLLTDGAYEYVCKMYTELHSSDWQILKRALEAKRFKKAFCYFSIKGCMCRIKKTLRSDYERRNIPQ